MIKKLFEENINEFTIDYDGDLFSAQIGKVDDSEVFTFKIKGEKSFFDIKTFGPLSYEYEEKDVEKLRKIYNDIMQKHGKKIIQILSKMEKELEKELENLRNDLKKL